MPRSVTNAAACAAAALCLTILGGGAVAAFGQAPPTAAPATPAATAIPVAPAGQVVGVGNFGHTVANLEKSIEFYHDVIGLDLARPAQPFASNPAISNMTDTVGGQ